MATYAIGDIQGCFDCLQKLLSKIQFSEQDELWLCGDMINRGEQNLETLRFIQSLGDRAHCVLGNHDLHALAVYHGVRKLKSSDTFGELLNSEEGHQLMHWLQQQPLMHSDTKLNVTMVHAGLAHHWTRKDIHQHAHHFHSALSSEQPDTFFNAIYGNKPNHWSQVITPNDILKYTFNAFTRMRMVSASGALDFNYKGPASAAPKELRPWFDMPRVKPLKTRVVFGHWSALGGHYASPYFCLDTGCVWGGQLTALRLEDEHLFQINC